MATDRQKRIDLITDMVGDAVCYRKSEKLTKDLEIMADMATTFADELAESGEPKLALMAAFISDLAAIIGIGAALHCDYGPQET